MTPPVLIVGLHRSGTSMLTRMLEALGLFVGKNLQDDHESMIMINVNNKYFQITNSSWDAPAYPEVVPTGENYIETILTANAELIAEKFGPMDGFWGFKDPRTLTTLPYWLKTFPDAKVIYIRRSPWDIARSLTKRHQKMIKDGLFPPEGNFSVSKVQFTQRCATIDGSLSFAMEQHRFFNALVQNGTVKNHLELCYEELVHDPLFQVSRLCEYLEHPATQSQSLQAASIPRRNKKMDEQLAFNSYFSAPQ
ncbi:sulfotransferase [Kordiimonas sp.]|uniref:sulfotransferase n=1 Tax=Kordiimonas sp. TaxID=1970157 RepID=UPI003A903DCE